MARVETGLINATYRTEGSRSALQDDQVFGPVFNAAKARIRAMELRFVEESDQLRQALLEMYVHVVLSTTYNDFDTH